MDGEKFGRLTVIELDHIDSKYRKHWACECECGGIKITRSYALHSGKAQSCGCLQKEKAADLCRSRSTHGQKHSPTYNTWNHMNDRCSNENNARYPDYRGRGIKVCDEWKSFEKFWKDMGDKPEGLTLERINNNEGYSPQNCKWATYSEQNKNRRPMGCGVIAKARGLSL